MNKVEHLKYPVGRFEFSGIHSTNELKKWKEIIAKFPELLAELTNDLSQAQKTTPYRPRGWMLKQVVHHCADSHMNAFIRFKLALTEDTPEIRPYLEAKWADLTDDLEDDLGPSIDLLKALHYKWSLLLENMGPQDFKRAYYHPEAKVNVSLAEATAQYAWHCRHHLAHVQLALDHYAQMK